MSVNSSDLAATNMEAEGGTAQKDPSVNTSESSNDVGVTGSELGDKPGSTEIASVDLIQDTVNNAKESKSKTHVPMTAVEITEVKEMINKVEDHAWFTPLMKKRFMFLVERNLLDRDICLNFTNPENFEKLKSILCKDFNIERLQALYEEGVLIKKPIFSVKKNNETHTAPTEKGPPEFMTPSEIAKVQEMMSKIENHEWFGEKVKRRFEFLMARKLLDKSFCLNFTEPGNFEKLCLILSKRLTQERIWNLYQEGFLIRDPRSPKEKLLKEKRIDATNKNSSEGKEESNLMTEAQKIFVRTKINKHQNHEWFSPTMKRRFRFFIENNLLAKDFCLDFEGHDNFEKLKSILEKEPNEQRLQMLYSTGVVIRDPSFLFATNKGVVQPVNTDDVFTTDELEEVKKCVYRDKNFKCLPKYQQERMKFLLEHNLLCKSKMEFTKTFFRYITYYGMTQRRVKSLYDLGYLVRIPSTSDLPVANGDEKRKDVTFPNRFSRKLYKFIINSPEERAAVHPSHKKYLMLSVRTMKEDVTNVLEQLTSLKYSWSDLVRVFQNELSYDISDLKNNVKVSTSNQQYGSPRRYEEPFAYARKLQTDNQSAGYRSTQPFPSRNYEEPTESHDYLFTRKELLRSNIPIREQYGDYQRRSITAEYSGPNQSFRSSVQPVQPLDYDQQISKKNAVQVEHTGFLSGINMGHNRSNQFPPSLGYREQVRPPISKKTVFGSGTSAGYSGSNQQFRSSVQPLDYDQQISKKNVVQDEHTGFLSGINPGHNISNQCPPSLGYREQVRPPISKKTVFESNTSAGYSGSNQHFRSSRAYLEPEQPFDRQKFDRQDQYTSLKTGTTNRQFVCSHDYDEPVQQFDYDEPIRKRAKFDIQDQCTGFRADNATASNPQFQPYCSYEPAQSQYAGLQNSTTTSWNPSNQQCRPRQQPVSVDRQRYNDSHEAFPKNDHEQQKGSPPKVDKSTKKGPRNHVGILTRDAKRIKFSQRNTFCHKLNGYFKGSQEERDANSVTKDLLRLELPKKYDHTLKVMKFVFVKNRLDFRLADLLSDDLGLNRNTLTMLKNDLFAFIKEKGGDPHLLLSRSTEGTAPKKLKKR